MQVIKEKMSRNGSGDLVSHSAATSQRWVIWEWLDIGLPDDNLKFEFQVRVLIELRLLGILEVEEGLLTNEVSNYLKYELYYVDGNYTFTAYDSRYNTLAEEIGVGEIQSTIENEMFRD